MRVEVGTHERIEPCRKPRHFVQLRLDGILFETEVSTAEQALQLSLKISLDLIGKT